MPVTVVVGGQFGSEGKGKVAYELAKDKNAAAVIRVGGSNSGHTIVDPTGKVRKFRSLPTASILPNMLSIIAAGSYIDPGILLAEIQETGVTKDQVIIDPNAVVITNEDIKAEETSSLGDAIGSTQSGTGAAVLARISRTRDIHFAKDIKTLQPYIQNTKTVMRSLLKSGKRIIVEGTQGYGLSILHANCYPFATSRDTTAAGFVSEAGLSPLDVDEVVMVIRAFPIRVAGNSGPLPLEIDWETVQQESGYEHTLTERTTVTNKVRRVARFDAEIVKAAIEANNPSSIVLNHVDYVDVNCKFDSKLTSIANQFICEIERKIDARIDYVGFSPNGIIRRHVIPSQVMSA
ncbi:adenylosuccinate synthetase [Emcibacter sp.]|uniref:adenylosuccinate synthetase n=1 Tax=Emcibacter sp. TaxID=1979954 RepID=UPI003A8EEA67